ncbi:DUF1361 domain-containing protein [Tepidibacter aestuarii]|uniref:DUF1361 domain-containing protein n=1 Tax=Tepidibacter aestuarii TaxID=2925782 RepID=UPI0020BDB442|nr:DUF1361 domain-containing protein [Tepidibacter aestuarii]CAH2212662.1 Uncharacterized membrane protein [Tepidibacter aestuarii]
MINKRLISIFSVFFLVTMMAVVMATNRSYKLNTYKYYIYIWNMFLAWIPFIFSLIVHNMYYKGKGNINNILIFICMCIWLLFYPNAPYIITDFIHISVSKYPFKIEDTLEFQRNFWIWYDFILIAFCALIGYLLGVASLYLNQIIVKDKFNNLVSWIFVSIVSFLSGYGIYLGRFVRFNSWDIVSNPIKLFGYIINSFKLEAIYFSLMFATVLLFTYVLVYSLINFKNNPE